MGLNPGIDEGSTAAGVVLQPAISGISLPIVCRSERTDAVNRSTGAMIDGWAAYLHEQIENMILIV